MPYRGRNGLQYVVRYDATPLYYQVNNILDNEYIFDQILLLVTLESSKVLVGCLYIEYIKYKFHVLVWPRLEQLIEQHVTNAESLGRSKTKTQVLTFN